MESIYVVWVLALTGTVKGRRLHVKVVLDRCSIAFPDNFAVILAQKRDFPNLYPCFANKMAPSLQNGRVREWGRKNVKLCDMFARVNSSLEGEEIKKREKTLKKIEKIVNSNKNRNGVEMEFEEFWKWYEFRSF